MTCDSTQLCIECEQPLNKDDIEILTMFGICHALLVHFPPP